VGERRLHRRLLRPRRLGARGPRRVLLRMLCRIARGLLLGPLRRVRIVGGFRPPRNIAPRLLLEKGRKVDCASNFARATEGTVRQRRALTRRQVLKASAGALPLVITAATASAQAAYPARPVKVVIPYPPAGGADTVGRLLFQKLGEMWGTQF